MRDEGSNLCQSPQIYADTAHKGTALLEEAMKALIPGSHPVEDCNAEGDELIAVNTTGFARREIVKIPLASARALADAAIQISHDGQAYVLFENEGAEPVVNATSMTQLAESKIAPARGELGRAHIRETATDLLVLVSARAVGSDFVLSNAQLSVTVSKKGCITSIVDLGLNRELIDEGQTAGFVIFEDRPLNWDAW